MAGILLSGPAGGGKSQAARDLLRNATEPTVAADFQSVVAALLLQERGPNGKYPLRPNWVLGLAEHVRRAIIDGATQRQIGLIITNSDGNPARRAALLDMLGPGATERIINPGEAVVRARLSDEVSGELGPDCEQAIARWFGRVNRG